MFLNEKLINIAIEEANKSTHKYFKLGCIIFKKKQIISTGHNHPYKSRHNLHPNFKKFKYSVHAEVDAILNARTSLKNCSLLVIRINKHNKLLNAKPCLKCLSYIKHVKIKKLFYSINEYPYIVELNVKKINYDDY